MHIQGKVSHPHYIFTCFFCVSAVIIDAPVSINGGVGNGLQDLPDKRAFAVSKLDVDQWESANGRIPDGAFVILRTGWSSYYTHPDMFFGNFADQEKQIFPGNLSGLHSQQSGTFPLDVVFFGSLF